MQLRLLHPIRDKQTFNALGYLLPCILVLVDAVDDPDDIRVFELDAIEVY